MFGVFFLTLNWLAKLAKWPVFGATVLTAIFFAPNLFGAGWGWIGVGHSSWSMAADQGIMPGSVTLHIRQQTYAVGNDVSFEYRGSCDPLENGRAVKRIDAINSDGSYRVVGLNPYNSDITVENPYDVPSEDIYGKIVIAVSPVPTFVWRRLSMGWELKVDQMYARLHLLLELPKSATAIRRFNVVWQEVPGSVVFFDDETYYVEDHIAGVVPEEAVSLRLYRDNKMYTIQRCLPAGWTPEGRLRFMIKRGPEFWIVDEDGGVLEHTKLE